MSHHRWQCVPESLDRNWHFGAGMVGHMLFFIFLLSCRHREMALGISRSHRLFPNIACSSRILFHCRTYCRGFATPCCESAIPWNVTGCHLPGSIFCTTLCLTLSTHHTAKISTIWWWIFATDTCFAFKKRITARTSCLNHCPGRLSIFIWRVPPRWCWPLAAFPTWLHHSDVDFFYRFSWTSGMALSTDECENHATMPITPLVLSLTLYTL